MSGEFATPNWADGATAGTAAAMGLVWDVSLPPVLKLLAICYADSPRSIERTAEWAGLSIRETSVLTAELVERGIVVPLDWDAPGREPSGTSPPAIPAAIRRAIFERDGWQCCHCGTEDKLSIDHIVARSKGGGDEEENLQTLCRSCNSRKGTKLEVPR